jgi:hypothetical protein
MPTEISTLFSGLPTINLNIAAQLVINIPADVPRQSDAVAIKIVSPSRKIMGIKNLVWILNSCGYYLNGFEA